MSQANRPRRVIQTVVVNVPNGSNIFSNLVGICCLKLRQLRVPLDFKEDFLPGGRQNLQIQRRRRERREIEADFFSIYRSDRATGVSKGGTDLDVDSWRTRILLFGYRPLGLLILRHDAKGYQRMWTSLNIKRLLPRRR